MVSKVVPVRLPDDVQRDLELVVETAQTQMGGFWEVTPSNVIRLLIKREAEEIRKNGRLSW